jgi:oxalate decarboxylase/phosphoglucose isomerase-like protein (cupin superfamily)
MKLEGEAKLVLPTKDRHCETQTMAPGVVNYSPGAWAHRIVNTGAMHFVFLAIWPIENGPRVVLN